MQDLEVFANGLTFQAVATGPRDGRPVLFLHGFPQTSYSWHHQLEAVGAAGYRGLGFDQRGYSPKARPPTMQDYRIGELVGDVLGVADAWGMEQFDLVGHDWGAMVAWVVAGRHPDRVRTLDRGVGAPSPCFRGGVAGPRTPGRSPEGDDDQRQRSSYIEVFRAEGGVAERALLGEDGSGEGLRLMFDASGLSSESDEVRRFVDRMLEPGAMTAALNWYRATEPHSLTDVGAITVPTLYVWSDEDIALGRERGGSDRGLGHGAVPFRGPQGCEPLDPRDRSSGVEPDPARAPGVERITKERAQEHLVRSVGRETGGMDPTPAFALDDTHKQFRSAIRQMCEERIAPHAAEVDRDAAFPWDGFKASVEMELPALGIPLPYGGAGADHVTQAIMVEELARVCASTSVTMLISKLAMMPIFNWGSEDLKKQYVPSRGVGRGPGQLLPIGGGRR